MQMEGREAERKAAQTELRERLNALRWQMQNCAARNDPGSFARLKQEYLSVYNIGEAKLEALDKRLRLAGNHALQAVTAAAENLLHRDGSQDRMETGTGEGGANRNEEGIYRSGRWLGLP